MKYLTKEEIIKIHKEIVQLYGIDSTILQPSNIDISIEAPKRMVYGIEIYNSLTKKAAALMLNLLKLHPFVDGNNRTGLAATSLFLEINGRELTSNSTSEVNACLETSICTWELDSVTQWIQNNSRRKFFD
jgi:death-on-curing protein